MKLPDLPQAIKVQSLSLSSHYPQHHQFSQNRYFFSIFHSRLAGPEILTRLILHRYVDQCANQINHHLFLIRTNWSGHRKHSSANTTICQPLPATLQQSASQRIVHISIDCIVVGLQCQRRHPVKPNARHQNQMVDLATKPEFRCG